jgi:F-type H+-transporting ATPase subunit b
MRRVLIAAAGAVLFCWAAAALVGPARADKQEPAKDKADQEKNEVKEKHEAGEKHEGGHESPGPFSADVGLWTLLIFLALFGLLYWKAWPLILEGLKKREQTIQSALDEARKAQADAEKLRAELQQEMNQAHDKVRGILDEGRRHAAQLQDEMLNKARADIQADRDRLRRELDVARDQALTEIWKRSADLAALMAAKALGRQISIEDQRRLIDESLEEIGRAGDGRLGKG